MTKALQITLPSVVNDVTIPKQNEIIFRVTKQGDGSGVAYIGIVPITYLSDDVIPKMSIIKGSGQFYLAPNKANPTLEVNCKTNNYSFLQIDSNDCYIRITNAVQIYGFFTEGLLSTTPYNIAKNWFTRIDNNSPQLDADVMDLLSARSLVGINLYNRPVIFPETKMYGDIKYLRSLPLLRSISFEGSKELEGSIEGFKCIDNGTLTYLAIAESNITGDLRNANLKNCEKLYAGDTLVKISLKCFRNVPNDGKWRTWAIGANGEGDLDHLPQQTGLSLILGFVPTYTRANVLKQTNLNRFSIQVEVPIGLYETLIADLNEGTNVTYISGALITLYVEAGQIANVSATTKNNITALRSKGVTVTTNVII